MIKVKANKLKTTNNKRGIGYKGIKEYFKNESNNYLFEIKND